MYTNYTMKEATNKKEAIISILDVIKENPVWLHQCDSYFLLAAKQLDEDLKENYLHNLNLSYLQD